jgi:hypothetical protein
MSDSIGCITVATVINSGQTQYPFGFSVERPVIVSPLWPALALPAVSRI